MTGKSRLFSELCDSAEEKSEVVAICDHLSRRKFSRTFPHAFTEHGAIMVASVLNTARAIEASIFTLELNA